MNMNLLEVLTPPSIYHGWYTRKTLWEEKFTVGEFTAVKMKNCGRWNVKKHRDIKDSENYVTLVISLKFDSLEKMRIISLESKEKLERLGKGLINSLSFWAKPRPNKYTRFSVES